MSRKRPGAPSDGVRILVFLLIIALVAGGCYGLYLYIEHRRAAEEVAQTQGAGKDLPDLTSDDRIIFGGMPRSTRPDVSFNILTNKAYIVGYSEARKDPLWSAYRVFNKVPQFKLARPRGNFLTDFRTKSKVTHDDYTGSVGYDRGHMTPNSAIARCYGAEAQHETFLMSNICPQASFLNQRVWEHLEVAELKYAEEDGEVWVIDGPIFNDLQPGETTPVKKLRTGVHIPDAFFKILIEDKSGGRGADVRTFAVIMPQTVKGTESAGQFTRPIKDIEAQTGLEFLWKLDPQVRAQIVSQANPPWAHSN